MVQDLEPFAQRAGLPDIGWGFARVRVEAGERVVASASVVDTLTNDATTVPAAREPGEALPDALVQWLEIAAHLPGLSGGGWRTDLVARNPSGSDATVDLALHTSDGEVIARDAVPGLHQGVFEDVVGLLGVEGKGALEIRSSVTLELGARIFNQDEPGTYGQSLMASNSREGLVSGEFAWLVGLRQKTDEYRTHISVTNSGTEPAAVRVTLFATDGTELVSYPLEVRPGMTRQDLQPFKWRAGQPDLGWGFARVEAVSGRGVFTSASVIDSRTNDAVTVTMQR